MKTRSFGYIYLNNYSNKPPIVLKLFILVIEYTILNMHHSPAALESADDALARSNPPGDATVHFKISNKVLIYLKVSKLI